MKTKLIIPLIIGAMLLGGGITYAATSNYYADLITGQKEMIQDELKQTYDDKLQEIGTLVHHDMVSYAGTSRDDLVTRLNSYMDRKLSAEQQERMNKHSTEIEKAVAKLENELESYIDKLVKDGK